MTTIRNFLTKTKLLGITVLILTLALTLVASSALASLTLSADGITTDKSLSLTGGNVDIPSLTVHSISGLPYASQAQSSWYSYAAWGDSLTYGYGAPAGASYPDVLGPFLGNKIVSNGGENGDTSTQITARMLAAPDKWGEFTIIWSGHNNSASPNTIKADIAAMVAVLPSPKRFLVLSLLNGDYPSYGINDTTYNAIVQLNNDLRTLYPDNYLDVRALLVAQYNPTNSQDVLDHGHDIPPSSLRSDALHLNSAGYAFVAHQIASWITTHDTGPADGLVDIKDVVKIFANPPPVGSSFPSTGAFTILTSSGDMGVGMSSPTIPLDVTGNHVAGIGIARFKGRGIYGFTTLDTTGTGGASGLVFKINGQTKSQLLVDDVTSTTQLFATAPNLVALAVSNATGNVGIGTTTASGKLVVSGHIHTTGSAPTLVGCGTGASIVGTDQGSKITIGTAPGTCVVTFNAPWINAPICVANNETSAVANRATSLSTTSATITDTLSAHDIVDLVCMGWE